MSQTLDSVFQLSDNQIISFITSNGHTHSNSLTDRLIATILIHNAGKIVESDKHYITNNNFNTYYLMSDQDLTNLYNKIPANNRKRSISGHSSRLGMVRDIIDDSTNTPRKLSFITLIRDDGISYDYLILDSDLERTRYAINTDKNPLTFREIFNRWASTGYDSAVNHFKDFDGDLRDDLLKLDVRSGYSGRGSSAKVELQSYGIIDTIYLLNGFY